MAERPRNACFTSIRKMAKSRFSYCSYLGDIGSDVSALSLGWITNPRIAESRSEMCSDFSVSMLDVTYLCEKSNLRSEGVKYVKDETQKKLLSNDVNHHEGLIFNI